MSRLLYNCHASWNCQGLDSCAGRVLHACGFDVRRRAATAPRDGYAIWDCDPSLWALSYGTCAEVCDRLATHSFMPISTPDYADWAGERKEWIPNAVKPIVAAGWPPTVPTIAGDIRTFITGCLEWQRQFQPSAYTAPTPPLIGASPEVDVFLKWMRAASSAASQFAAQETTYISVAIEDRLMGGLSDMILDQLTARDGVGGVYLTPITSDAELANRFDEGRAIALMDMIHQLSRFFPVIVNFTDLFGLLAVVAGADAIGIGYEVKGQRLLLGDYRDTTGGGAYPQMLSLAFGRRLTIPELESLNALGLLDRLQRDRTPESADLLDAVEAKQDIRLLQPWAPTRSNVSAAHRHLTALYTAAVGELSPKSPDERRSWAKGWLDTASTNVSDWAAAAAKTPRELGVDHVHVWAKLFA